MKWLSISQHVWNILNSQDAQNIPNIVNVLGIANTPNTFDIAGTLSILLIFDTNAITANEKDPQAVPSVLLDII